MGESKVQELSLDRESLIKISEEGNRDSAVSFFSDAPECEECGLLMFGHKTESGAWCARCDMEGSDE